MFLKY